MNTSTTATTATTTSAARPGPSTGDLRLVDWFCGAGGSTQGAVAVPGVRPVHAANHWAKAIETHAENFPDVDHWRGDIREVDVARLPYAELFWASPECTNWSRAKGRRQDYASTDLALPGLEEPAPAEEVERSRALMEEVPLYLRAMALRGRPVLAGVVENVVDIRAWADWDRWRAEIEAVGYRSRLVALNSMHAQSVVTPRAPQSRDRLYLAYWHVSLGRDPDWDKWLRPAAWCPRCGGWVRAVQVFKTPGRDMGRYRSQYVYRCPATSCRGTVVEPAFVPAAAVIDWSLPGERIGDKPLREFFTDKKRTQSLGFHPLAPKTLARIHAGIRRYARPVEAAGNQVEGVRRALVPPMLVPAGGGWNDDAARVTVPMRARTTSESEGVLVPPLLVPVEGRDGKTAGPVARPLRTQSTRSETAVVTVGVRPFIAELRGGGSVARPVSEALATVTASGNHHGLVVPEVPAMVMRNNGSRGPGGEMCTPATQELRTLTAAGHQSLVTWEQWAALYAYDAGVRDCAEADRSPDDTSEITNVTALAVARAFTEKETDCG